MAKRPPCPLSPIFCKLDSSNICGTTNMISKVFGFHLIKSHLNYETLSCNICGTINMMKKVFGFHLIKSHLNYETLACNICGTTNMMRKVFVFHLMKSNYKYDFSCFPRDRLRHRVLPKNDPGSLPPWGNIWRAGRRVQWWALQRYQFLDLPQ